MEVQSEAVQPIGQTQSIPKKSAMRWYYFTIYFRLFAAALSMLITGIVSISSMRVVDIVFGVVWVGFAIYAIVVRNLLAEFKRCAPMCLYILLAGYIGVQVVYWIAELCVSHGAMLMNIYLLLALVLTTCLYIAFFAIDVIYFKKRKYWFTGSRIKFDLFDDGHRYIPDDHEGDDWWFAFLIYFALFASAAVYFIDGLYLIILSAYSSINSVVMISIIIGSVFMIAGIFMLIMRFLLAAFKRAGVICIYIMYGIVMTIETVRLVAAIIMSCMTGANVVGFLLVVEWLWSMIVSCSNFIYFKKRKHIFR